MRSPAVISLGALLSLAYAQNFDPKYVGQTSCSNPFLFDNASISVLSSCTVLGEGVFGLAINASIAGPILIPNVQTINSSLNTFGDGLFPNYPNITSFEMPDLENVTDGFYLVDVWKLTTLDVPKLKTVEGPIMFNNLLGASINLSFPALETVGGPVYFLGNIDSLSLPSIKSIGAISINSTGNLDCSSLSKALDSCTITIGHDSLICHGKNDAEIGNFVDTTPTGTAPVMTSSTMASARVCSSTVAATTTSPSVDNAGGSGGSTSSTSSVSPTKTPNSGLRNGVGGVGLLMTFWVVAML